MSGDRHTGDVGGSGRTPGAAPAERLSSVLRGDTGVLCVGVTFLPAEAVSALRWGADAAEYTHPAVAVCSRLAPDFAFVPVWEPDAERATREISECGTLPFSVVRGPLTAVATELGWTAVLRATVEPADEFAKRLDRATEVARAEAAAALSWGAAAIVVAEDVAGATGPLVAPDYVIGDLMLRLARIASVAREAGRVSLWHSDGDIRAFLRVAKGSDFDAVHPAGLEQHVFETLLEDARRLGIAVLGGIPGKALGTGGPVALRAGAHAALLAAPGGLLVCDDGSVSSGPELAALISALEAARDPSSEGA